MKQEDVYAEAVPTQFESIGPIDVTDTLAQICWCVTCPVTWAAMFPGIMGKKELTMEEEEVVYTYNCCNMCHANKRMPYGELGNVEKGQCLCFVVVNSNLTTLCPGCGCETNKVVSEYLSRTLDRNDSLVRRK